MLSLVNVLVGVWVLLSPWLLEFSEFGRPAWNAAATGLGIAVIAAAVASGRYASVVWGNVLLGPWLLASPWVLDYLTVETASGNAVISGAVVMVVAGAIAASDDGMASGRRPGSVGADGAGERADGGRRRLEPDHDGVQLHHPAGAWDPDRGHRSWLFLFALVVWSLATVLFPATYPGLDGAICLVIAAVVFLASVLAHELGHALRAVAAGLAVAATRSAARAGPAFGILLVAIGLLGLFTGGGLAASGSPSWAGS
jgi:hypothetical protein